MTAQSLNGLHYLHKMCIIHRDFKVTAGTLCAKCSSHSFPLLFSSPCIFGSKASLLCLTHAISYTISHHKPLPLKPTARAIFFFVSFSLPPLVDLPLSVFHSSLPCLQQKELMGFSPKTYLLQWKELRNSSILALQQRW